MAALKSGDTGKSPTIAWTGSPGINCSISRITKITAINKGDRMQQPEEDEAEHGRFVR